MTSRTDPFTLTIIHNALLSAAEEMFTVTAKTAKSPIIYDVLDFSAAITDHRGDVVAQATGIPLFIGIFDYMVKGVIQRFGMQDFSAGDVVILNDPYMSGTHLNDVGVVMPVFEDEALVAFATSKGHWNDVGGAHFGSWGPGSVEIYQEGLQIPPSKLYRADEVNRDLIDLIGQNSRIPDYILGDLQAQVASLRVASSRINSLAKKYGLEAVCASVTKILQDGETIARSKMKDLPKGSFEAQDSLDESGVTEEPLPIRVKVEIDDSRFKVDFTGAPKQVPASLNTTYPATVAAVRIVYVAMIDPHLRYNQGLVAPLEVSVPPGTIFSAQRPAPVSVYWETMTYAADLVWKALAPHAPQKLTAGHFLSVVAEIIAGVDPRTNEGFALVEPNPGGWGAGSDKDGESALVSFADGETYAASTEVIEIRYPIRVERYEYNVDDGAGAGRHRGGFGIIKDYRILADGAEFTTDINRARFPPWGVAGGGSGTLNYMVVFKDGQAPLRVRKIASLKLKAGDLISIRTGGGGGWGEPLDRPSELVERDVRNGYLTLQRARETYGVVLEPATLAANLEATNDLRVRLKGKGEKLQKLKRVET